MVNLQFTHIDRFAHVNITPHEKYMLCDEITEYKGWNHNK